MNNPGLGVDIKLAETLFGILVRHHPELFRQPAESIFREFDIADGLARAQLRIPSGANIPAHRWNLWMLSLYAHVDLRQRRLKGEHV